ncbi:hypothetical protein HMPREF1978_01712 [Actinomyces graevenitzii F0530]|uniref:Aminoglycoside phosphotransferase domain-containing protein n=1 Tax=Actinomyces graevenitzii F0530 TaxID=1321817 RepID=U1PWQ7_9ACTO|nr:phosphotransferase [Actinomyces graevenitzii]ERH14534.1 hypothetical protein HMPREF1978_01712 [Actinomyces graevenitzii F0530]
MSRERSYLNLAALAVVAAPNVIPARLALPQHRDADQTLTGLIDVQGRHWEVIHTTNPTIGAALIAESRVLKQIGRRVDGGYVDFDVPRPEGGVTLPDKSYVQVRTHIPGHPLAIESLRPGPGLAAGLGRALAQLHEIPPTLIEEAGLPVLTAADVRSNWQSLFDDAAMTGKVDSNLLARWESALDEDLWWRFHPVVVHGDLAEENIITGGGSILAFKGLSQMRVGDPAEDLAWVYSSAPIDTLDVIEEAYDRGRIEGVDKYLRLRAELVSELNLARWLLHGVRTKDEAIIDEAVEMLEDLAEQVGDELFVERSRPMAVVASNASPDISPDDDHGYDSAYSDSDYSNGDYSDDVAGTAYGSGYGSADDYDSNDDSEAEAADEDANYDDAGDYASADSIDSADDYHTNADLADSDYEAGSGAGSGSGANEDYYDDLDYESYSGDYGSSGHNSEEKQPEAKKSERLSVGALGSKLSSSFSSRFSAGTWRGREPSSETSSTLDLNTGGRSAQSPQDAEQTPDVHSPTMGLSAASPDLGFDTSSLGIARSPYSPYSPYTPASAQIEVISEEKVTGGVDLLAQREQSAKNQSWARRRTATPDTATEIYRMNTTPIETEKH